MEYSFYILNVLSDVDANLAFKIPFLIFIGLCLGSFASAVAYRAPLGLPWAFYRVRSTDNERDEKQKRSSNKQKNSSSCATVNKNAEQDSICVAQNTEKKHLKWRAVRSICPQCDAILTSKDLIPLLSWLMNRGKCRHCAAPISPIYLVFETLTATLYTLISLELSLSSFTFLFFTLAFPFLIVTGVNLTRGKGLSPKVIGVLFFCLIGYFLASFFTEDISPYY